MFRPDTRYFSVPPLNTGWDAPSVADKPSFADDESKKKEYGIELAKNDNAFEAACELFKEDTGSAVWVSLHWITDPIVLASRDFYAKTIEQAEGLLDKEQFAARLLSLSDTLFEGKDRLKALELYAKVQGFIDKPDDNSTKIFNNNGITIKVVKTNTEEKTVELTPPPSSIAPEILDSDNALPVRLKLVS